MKNWLHKFYWREEQYLEQGIPIIGVDEVNVFSSLQPIIVAAIKIVPPVTRPLIPVADCKQLTEAERRRTALQLMKHLPFYVDYCDFDIVDGGGNYRTHELEVIKRLLYRAISEGNGNAVAFVDYYRVPGSPIPQYGISNGDDLYYSIAAASIIARYHYDVFRKLFLEVFDEYHYSGGFSKNAIEEMRQHGFTIFHRHSWVNNSCRKRHWPIITKENRDEEREQLLLNYLSRMRNGAL